MVTNTKISVRYAETDQMQIAHHSNYAIWFEAGRTDFIKAHGISYTDIEKAGIILPLLSLECQYKKAAFYEDELIVQTKLTKVTNTKLTFTYRVLRGEEVISTGSTVHGIVDSKLRPIRLKRDFAKYYEFFKNAMSE